MWESFFETLPENFSMTIVYTVDVSKTQQHYEKGELL